MFDGVGLPGFKSRANAFQLASFLSPNILYFSYFDGLVVWGGVFGLIESEDLSLSHSPGLALLTPVNNNNNKMLRNLLLGSMLTSNCPPSSSLVHKFMLCWAISCLLNVCDHVFSCQLAEEELVLFLGFPLPKFVGGPLIYFVLQKSLT